ncbi:MAG: hypothetical protein Q4F95_01980 [Oscillospiraceae bacterium]|nr:hypothetical protein [Oscillospiraceae bacterium]
MNDSQKEKRCTTKILIIILIIITLASIGVSIWVLFFREKPTILAPDYAPHEIETNAIPIEDDDTSKMDSPSGGGAVSLTYSKEVTIDLSDKKAALMFANPSKSTQDIVLQLVIKDTVVIQSGRLTPRNQVTRLDLLEDTENLLVEGGYEGKFVVLYYNQQSGEKAMVNTEIPVSVNVTA